MTKRQEKSNNKNDDLPLRRSNSYRSNLLRSNSLLDVDKDELEHRIDSVGNVNNDPKDAHKKLKRSDTPFERYRQRTHKVSRAKLNKKTTHHAKPVSAIKAVRGSKKKQSIEIENRVGKARKEKNTPNKTQKIKSRKTTKKSTKKTTRK